jgi:hypothetical protein
MRAATRSLSWTDWDAAPPDQVDFRPLADADARIVSGGSREIASFLMQDAILRIRSGFGSGSVGEQLAASRQLYESLLDSVEYHLQCVQHALK